MHGVPKAISTPYKGDGWAGDVREGSSCNFETVVLTPHCNGTHTECIGHLTAERFQIMRMLRDVMVPATLVTVTPRAAKGSGESYQPVADAGDMLILRKDLEALLTNSKPEFLKAVIIRTLPNGVDKCGRNYSEVAPAFFSNEAMQYLHDLGIEHLLTDLPSIDRMRDEGRLSNHHIWWDIPQGSHAVDHDRISFRTITELIYVPGKVKDGICLLNLQVAPFLGDAAPSRPVIFELKELQ